MQEQVHAKEKRGWAARPVHREHHAPIYHQTVCACVCLLYKEAPHRSITHPTKSPIFSHPHFPMASHVSILSFATAAFPHSALLAVAPPRSGRHDVLTLAAPGAMLSCDRLALLAVAVPRERVALEPAGRRAVVCFQTDGPPSGDDDQVKWGDAFRTAMERFQLSHRPIALLGNKDLLDEVMETAESCRCLLDKAVDVVLISPEHSKDIVRVGEAFLRVAGQAREGYVRADALVEATDGLMLMSAVFIESPGYLPPYANTVPLSSVDVDKETYFTELTRAFTILFYAVAWQIRAAFDLKFDF